jgi:hypothetical protein
MEQQLVGIERSGEAENAYQAGYGYEDDGDHMEQKYNNSPKKW